MDSIVNLCSGEFTASINCLGAELFSLNHVPTGNEFIWHADKEVWPRHAPILFPFVGRLKNFEYRINGESYMMEQHGFARDLMFTLENSNENNAVFELTDNNHTWQRYPFRFSFKLRYTLDKNSLMIGFEIYNRSESYLPVSFGGHPAFTVQDPEDSVIVFENDADPDCWLLEDNFISRRHRKVSDGNGRIYLNAHSFDKDAFVFKNLKSKWIKILSKTSKKIVSIHIENWPYLGIWAKPAANFVCIEPWQGIADSADFEGDVSKKEGILMIAPNEFVKNSFCIEVWP